MSSSTQPGTAPSAQSSAKSYGFIGLGIMGWGMAKNLRIKIPKESSLYVCEVNEQRRDQFIDETAGIGNVRALPSPVEVARKSDIIITMLPRGEHVREVFLNPANGLLSVGVGQANEIPKIFIDCSSIDVKTSQDISDAVEKSGLGAFADAPVSGGQGGANAGTLTFMVGGDGKVYESIKPTLAHMGNPENIFHCGKIGAGLATKLINNYMSAVNMIGVCEGMNLGRLYGLDLAKLASVVNTSTGMSRNSREQNPVKGISPTASSANDFKGGFSAELCQGVVEMSAELGESLGAKSVLGPAVREFYSDAVENDKCKGMDFRSIYRLFTDDDAEK